MTTQPTLFPEVKHIPQWLAEHFNNANAGDYRDKQLFYSDIKYQVLEKYAEKTGWDKQIIEKKCWSCSGTGIFKIYSYGFIVGQEKCWNCNKGIYAVHTIYLKRYLLNGVLYHIPQFEDPKQPIVNVIEGIIEHKEIEAEKALKSFLILCSIYNKQLLRDLAVRYMKEKYQYSFLQSLLSGKFKKDELPF